MLTGRIAAQNYRDGLHVTLGRVLGTEYNFTAADIRNANFQQHILVLSSASKSYKELSQWTIPACMHPFTDDMVGWRHNNAGRQTTDGMGMAFSFTSLQNEIGSWGEGISQHPEVHVNILTAGPFAHALQLLVPMEIELFRKALLPVVEAYWSTNRKPETPPVGETHWSTKRKPDVPPLLDAYWEQDMPMNYWIMRLADGADCWVAAEQPRPRDYDDQKQDILEPYHDDAAGNTRTEQRWGEIMDRWISSFIELEYENILIACYVLYIMKMHVHVQDVTLRDRMIAMKLLKGRMTAKVADIFFHVRHPTLSAEAVRGR